ncbi:LOW QUALITY PROTEIN: uncharacterized protein LOC128397482 [Panonychus citri]|uniref:LOW QUALITY PROTEIN: uncharacterized protein LOC128397482 n=1 Tax=Panonychus citri TaxID=50023 RepID=UPI002307EFED|nr:LOW QUALITY PROTEIN: uncharacterized protein LOC128397482 [Panonychus citri]
MEFKLWFQVKQKVFLVFVILVVYIIFEVLFLVEDDSSNPYYERIVNRPSFYSYDERDEWFESTNSSFCELPFNMDPYDPMIKVFIHQENSFINCSKSNDSFYNLSDGKSLSYMNDVDGIVHIFRIQEYDKSLKCLYQQFDRDGESDKKIKYFEWKPIIGYELDLEKLGIEFVIIECFLSNELIYTNIHSWPSRVPSSSSLRIVNNSSSFSSSFELTINESQLINNRSTKPSVMFLIIESISYLNYKRFMSQTELAVSKLSNFFILRGLNKLADNSYPNMMPILTGHRPRYEQWPFNMSNENGPFDEVPFIWKDFKALNYTTGYIEDDPTYQLLSYSLQGFRRHPVDWYPRPYWLEMDILLRSKYREFCYNGEPKIVHWLKQVKQFLNKATRSNLPFFLWSFYIQVTHTDFNKAQMIDGYIADFIDSYRSILDDTIFILMGDHGNRYGLPLQTAYAQIESRMPLFGIHIPPKLLSEHKHLSEYLKKNEKKLTTWLDVREILKDIVAGQYTPIVSSSKRKAYSVWREEVPSNRTCQDALIPMEFCLCSKKHIVSTNLAFARHLASVVIDHLNQLLQVIDKDICLPLSLKEIHSLKSVDMNDNPHINRSEVILSVHPSNGTFQAQLYETVDAMNATSWSVEGDISRINSYGFQSLCIMHEKVLMKYCYCRIQSRPGQKPI